MQRPRGLALQSGWMYGCGGLDALAAGPVRNLVGKVLAWQCGLKACRSWFARGQRSDGARSFGLLASSLRAGLLCLSPSMFGMPNINGGLRAVDRRQRSGAAKRRGELDGGIPRAKSLCGYEGRID